MSLINDEILDYLNCEKGASEMDASFLMHKYKDNTSYKFSFCI